MTVTALPTPPSRSGAPNSFGVRSAAFLAAMPLFQQELNGKFTAFTTLNLAGLTGFSLAGLPATLKKLSMKIRIQEPSSTTNRSYRLRFGPAAGISVGATYAGSRAAYGATNVGVGEHSSSFTLFSDITVAYYITATVFRVGTNRYLFDCISRGQTGNLHHCNGRLSLGAPLAQLNFDNTIATSLTTPILSGTVECSWRT